MTTLTFKASVVPLLHKYCNDCHGNGESEGDLTLDNFTSEDQAAAEPQLWWNVLKNLRAGVMPPAGESRPSHEELELIARWIKTQSFQIQPDNPDPGRLSVRRLNRNEYGNTVSDLMGIDFDVTILFPPDDSGSGFDNVGDALTFSPLLMEKYLQAAGMIVDQAVPTVTKILPQQKLRGHDFKNEGDKRTSEGLDGKKSASVRKTIHIDAPGTYLLGVEVKLHGSFDFDPARYNVTFRVDGQERFQEEYGWDESKLVSYHYEEAWEAGDHKFEFNLDPIRLAQRSGAPYDGESRDDTNVRFEVHSVLIEGPVGTDKLVHPPNYERFFTRDEPPGGAEERRAYAEELLERFAQRAFRGRVEQSTLDRLVDIAESVYNRPDKTFEAGVGRAMVAVLASPRFLFRLESATPPDGPQAKYGLVDELSLASRLSYLFWSTMPDDELFRLAKAGQLREQLAAQIDRMMQDPRSKEFVGNFVGQWLRTRDVTQMAIDPLVVLGFSEEYEAIVQGFRGRSRRPRESEMSDDERKTFARFRELRAISERFDNDLKSAIRRETEMCFEYIVSENLSLLELLDSDYTFLNEKLAEHYGIPDVSGRDMRRVQLPEESARGGLLTQASMLLITSNPTRTSPVKRGLFILDNILGTPAPPAPAVVPELEESASKFADKEPTLRDLLAAHRESALCASCHARMDPLGLALENFNALGMWRDTEKGQPIDPAGVLITGEKFQNIRELKRVLREHHASDFYRCVTQKLLIYAIGRGLDYTDEHTVDLIVQRLQANDGKFSSLLEGIVQSAPFQSIRIVTNDTALTTDTEPIDASGDGI